MQNASAPVSGEFTVSLEGRSTTALSWGATAADLEEAVADSLGALGQGVVVSFEGDDLRGFNYSFTFAG
jgi:hypothetical protein